MVDITDFSNGNYISVGFIDAESTKPLVDEIARIFNKKSNDTTLQKGLSELKKSIDKNTETTKKNNNDDLISSINSLAGSIGSVGSSIPGVGGALLKFAGVMKKVAIVSIKQYGKAIESMKTLDSTGISLNRGFVELRENANLAGLKTSEMAKLLAQSSKTLKIFNNTGKEGSDVFTDLISNANQNLYTSQEYTSLINDFVQNNPLTRISSPSFKADFEMFALNTKALSLATGKTVDNLLEEQKIKSDKNAVKYAQQVYKNEFAALKTAGLSDEIIMNILSGGTKFAKERVLLTANNPEVANLVNQLESAFKQGQLKDITNGTLANILSQFTTKIPNIENRLEQMIKNPALMAGAMSSESFDSLNFSSVPIINALKQIDATKLTKEEYQKYLDNVMSQYLKTANNYKKVWNVGHNAVQSALVPVAQTSLETFEDIVADLFEIPKEKLATEWGKLVNEYMSSEEWNKKVNKFLDNVTNLVPKIGKEAADKINENDTPSEVEEKIIKQHANNLSDSRRQSDLSRIDDWSNGNLLSYNLMSIGYGITDKLIARPIEYAFSRLRYNNSSQYDYFMPDAYNSTKNLSPFVQNLAANSSAIVAGTHTAFGTVGESVIQPISNVMTEIDWLRQNFIEPVANWINSLVGDKEQPVINASSKNEIQKKNTEATEKLTEATINLTSAMNILNTQNKLQAPQSVLFRTDINPNNQKN